MMGHGPHDNCIMCRMARAIGMMEKHPKDCNCQEKRKDKHQEYEEALREHAHAA